jgi:hypothetical protein
MNAARLETFDAESLLLMQLKQPPFIVEGILPLGLHMFCGAPKVGKSWLVLDLALSVSSGTPFWGLDTTACGVLYLCLEDTYHRIQQRLFALVDQASSQLHLAISSCKLDAGLIPQLEAFLQEYPQTKLVILDTLQTVRSMSRESAYAADYNDLSKLKKFADANGLAVLAIHHTRKAPDDDDFNTVSGTTGITGCADSTFILKRDERDGNSATLRGAGRDVEFQEYKLCFRNCRWELLEKTSTEELETRMVPDEVVDIIGFVQSRGVWRGTAGELVEALGLNTTIACVLAKWINQHRQFLRDRGIEFTSGRTKDSRFIQLRTVCDDTGDTNDSKSDTPCLPSLSLSLSAQREV